MKLPKHAGVRLAITIASCSLVLACNGESPATTTDEEPAAVAPETQQKPAAEDTMDTMTSDEQVAHAIERLAKRLGAAADEIEVDSVRAVQWRSGAAGCPKPGMNYTMAITPGVQILLSARGAVYRYHAAGNRAPKYCPPDRAEAPAYGQGEEVM